VGVCWIQSDICFRFREAWELERGGEREDRGGGEVLKDDAYA